MKKKIIIISVFLCLLQHNSIVSKSPLSVEWETLAKLNSQTGKMPKELKKFMNKVVSVSGFIVPLDNDGYIDTVKEFLLIPQPLSCYHVPMPPANQIVYVMMKDPIPLDIDLTGVEITGKLSPLKDEYDDGEILYSFQINGNSAKEADIDFEIQYIDESFDEFEFPF